MKRLALIVGLVVASVAINAHAADKALDCSPVTESELSSIKNAMINELKDPDSILVRNVCRTPVLDHGKETGSIAFCGVLNSKNSYGAYAGYTDFFYVMGGKKGSVRPSRDAELLDHLDFEWLHCMICDQKTPSECTAQSSADAVAPYRD